MIFFRKNDATDHYGWATIIPTAGGNAQKLKMPVPASDVVAFAWAADGKSILYARNEHRETRLEEINCDFPEADFWPGIASGLVGTQFSMSAIA